MSQPDPISGFGTLAALPRPWQDGEGPVFAEPWQAQVFALSEQGHFTWKEWTVALADEHPQVLAQALKVHGAQPKAARPLTAAARMPAYHSG